MQYFISKRNIPNTLFILLILTHQKRNIMIELSEGQKAPDFSAKDQNGKLISLSDFEGKNIILYFYPKDDTPGCTAEAIMNH
jgi:peroxiredoxin